MLGLESDGPIETREITFGPSTGSGRSRRGLAAGGVITALVIGGIVAVSSSDKNSATSPTTTAAVELATSSTTVAASTTTFEPEATTTTSLPERQSLGRTPMLGEPTGLELWYQVSFSGPLSSPSGIYRIDLDNAVQERLTSTMYFNGQSVVGATDGHGLHLYGSGDAAFHLDRAGAVRHGPQLNGNVVSTDRDGYWLQTEAESSSNGLALTLEHHRFDGSLIASVPAPPNAYVESGGGEAMFLLRGADARSYLFDAVANEVTSCGDMVARQAVGFRRDHRGSDGVAPGASGADCDSDRRGPSRGFCPSGRIGAISRGRVGDLRR
jgi:hypothetical protein